MSDVGSHRAARTIGLALVAGLVAFEVVLVVTAGAIGIPGALIVPLSAFGARRAVGGGESIVAKQASQAAAPVKTADLGGAPLEQAGSPAAPAPDPFASVKLMPPPVVVDEPAMVADAVSPDPVNDPQDLSLASNAAPANVEDAAPKPADASHDLTLASISAPIPSVEEASTDEKPEPRKTLRNSRPTEDLPWGDTVPVPLSQLVSNPSARSAAASPPAQPQNDMRAWVKSKALELAGGVDDQGRRLYGFELWVEPPAEVKQRLVSVAYDVDSASAQPRTQESSEQETGFLVRYGSASCADKITLTLKFNDGQSRQVAIDGCKLQG